MVYWIGDIMWWFLFAAISMSDGYLFIKPKFKTHSECANYARENGFYINSWVNKEYEFPDERINPIFCITEKDYNEMKDNEKGQKT